MQSHSQTSAWVTPSSFSTTKMKDDDNFSGSGKRISITMTTVWRCALCQRRIQITQWSGARACNLLAKIEFRCGWLRWREWDCVLLVRSAADREHTRVRQYPPAVTAIKISALLPGAILQIRRAPRSAATWVDVIDIELWHNECCCVAEVRKIEMAVYEALIVCYNNSF